MVAPRPSTSFVATLTRRIRSQPQPPTPTRPFHLLSRTPRYYYPTTCLESTPQRRSIVSVAAFKNLLSRRRQSEQDVSEAQSINKVKDSDKQVALKASAPKGLFDAVAEEEQVVESVKLVRGQVGRATYHKSSTANFKTSKRKLNDLSRLIAGRGADEAILQLQMSPKKQAARLLSMLALARDHAMAKGLSRDQLVVGKSGWNLDFETEQDICRPNFNCDHLLPAQSWTSKGPSLKRLDIKGRGRFGIKHHNSAKLHVLLAEGITEEEKRRQRKKDQWRKSIRGLTEGDVGVGNGARPLINVGVGDWRW